MKETETKMAEFCHHNFLCTCTTQKHQHSRCMLLCKLRSVHSQYMVASQLAVSQPQYNHFQ
jgi:hypothetical protein